MTELWFIEDPMSGEVMEHRYYQTHAEATTRHNEMGYGIVKSFEFQDGGTFKPKCGKCPLGAMNGPCR